MLKEPLIKSRNFWQRQNTGIKAWSCRKANCLSNDRNAEFSELAVSFFETVNSIMHKSGILAKPRRARLQAIISVVALLVKAASIPFEVRLRHDGL